MKICPDCQNRYDDDVANCPDDGEELVELPKELSGNPQLPQPMSASPTDRTSMLDLEALEAKRAAQQERHAQQGDRDEDAGADDETPPPQAPLEQDDDATGTLQRKGARKRPAASQAATPREATRRGQGPADAGHEQGAEGGDAAAEQARAEEPTGQTRARATRTGLSRAGTNARGRSRTSQSRVDRGPRDEQPGEAPAPEPAGPGRDRGGSRGVRAAAITVIALCLLVGGIVAVARGTAVLTVTTVPPGASVTIDGEGLGTTPIQKRMRLGSHRVEIELDGFLPFKEVVDLPAGGLPYLQPLQKRPPPPPPPPTPSQIALDLAAQATQLAANGELDTALERIDEARKLDGAQPAVVEAGTRIDAAIRKRDLERAAAAATAGREQRLKEARMLVAEGKQLYEKGRLGDAKDKLYKSLQQDAHNPEPHRLLSRIFNREDQVDKVRYHLTRYLELGGADADFKVREWLKAHPP